MYFQRIVSVLLGVFLMLFGLAFLTYIYAFLSMMPQEIAGRNRLNEILKRIIDFPNFIAVVVGIVIFIVGASVFVNGLKARAIQ